MDWSERFERIYLPATSPIGTVVIDDSGRKLVIKTSDGYKTSLNIDKLVEPTDMYYHSTTRTYPQSLGSTKPKVEKRYTLPADKFSLIDFTELGIVDEDKSAMPKFIVGENYALGGEKVDGFSQKHRLYNLVGMVDEFAGTKIDSLIVKQIGGEDSGNIYTISKSDCSFLGIEYQSGLQLFSKSLKWKHVRNIREFNEHNLATSPTSEIDNSIRYLVLKLDGFTDYSDGYVLSPSGKLIKENQFVQSIQVITKEPVVYGNGHVIQDKVPLRASVTHPRAKLFNHANFISSEDEVFILIELVENRFGKPYLGVKTFDGKFGVDPKYFEGLDPNDYLEVSWDELGGLTVEEYEENKRKAAEEAERAAKEAEEERKRILAEEEKARAEKARLEALAVERMKKFKIREPDLSAVPTFNPTIDPLVGLDMYLDKLDKYFDNIDSSLDSLMFDLSKFQAKMPGRGRGLDMWSNAYRQGMLSAKQLTDFLKENF